MHLVYATWCLLDAPLCQHQVCIFGHIEILTHGIPASRYRGLELTAPAVNELAVGTAEASRRLESLCHGGMEGLDMHGALSFILRLRKLSQQHS